MYSTAGHVIYRQARGCLDAKLHTGLHMRGGQTDVSTVTCLARFLASINYHFFLWCSAVKKNMNDHDVRDEVDDWQEYLIGQQQRHRFLTNSRKLQNNEETF